MAIKKIAVPTGLNENNEMWQVQDIGVDINNISISNMEDSEIGNIIMTTVDRNSGSGKISSASSLKIQDIKNAITNQSNLTTRVANLETNKAPLSSVNGLNTTVSNLVSSTQTLLNRINASTAVVGTINNSPTINNRINDLNTQVQTLQSIHNSNLCYHLPDGENATSTTYKLRDPKYIIHMSTNSGSSHSQLVLRAPTSVTSTSNYDVQGIFYYTWYTSFSNTEGEEGIIHIRGTQSPRIIRRPIFAGYKTTASYNSHEAATNATVNPTSAFTHFMGDIFVSPVKKLTTNQVVRVVHFFCGENTNGGYLIVEPIINMTGVARNNDTSSELYQVAYDVSWKRTGD